jgi:uncharacterized protein (AIM24 family)
MFTNEKLFMNKYTARTNGEIVFSSSFPGSIRCIEITPDRPVIAQKGAFLAATEGIDVSVFFQKKVGNMFFGGEGLVMEQFTGNGLVFLEVDGSAHEYDLAPGQKKILDTGYLVSMDASCSMDIVTIKGVKNVLFGGEGLFNTVVTGPGHITIQSMPIATTAAMLSRFMPSTKG